MMNLIVGWLTALGVFLHVTLGCCVHHFHPQHHSIALECSSEQSSASCCGEIQHCESSHRGHKHDRHSVSRSTEGYSQPPANSCRAAQCQEAHCVFGMEEIKPVVFTVVSMDRSLIDGSGGVVATVKLQITSSVFNEAQSSLGVLRAHLLNCVLLI